MDEDAWSLISSSVASTRTTPASEHSGFVFVSASAGCTTEVGLTGPSRIAYEAADLPPRLSASDLFLGESPLALSTDALADYHNDYDYDDELDTDSLPKLPPTASTNPAVAAHLDGDTAASCWDDLLVQSGREMSRKMRETTGKTHVAVSEKPGGQWLIREKMCDVDDDPRPRSHRWVTWWVETRWYWPQEYNVYDGAGRYEDASDELTPAGPWWGRVHKRFCGVLLSALKYEFLKDDEDDGEGDLYSRLITSLRFLDLTPVPDRELISTAQAVAHPIGKGSQSWRRRPPNNPRDETLVLMALAAESTALHAVHDDPPLAGASHHFSRAVAMRRHPAPAAPYHSASGGLVETRLARLALAAIGPERAVAAINYLRTEDGMRSNNVPRHVAIEILHPDGAAARHADLLPGLEDIDCPCAWCSPPPKPVNPYWKKTRRAPGRGKLGGDTL